MNTGCGKPAVRPLVDTGAMVFVVFGIRGVNRTRHLDNHVLGDMVHLLCRLLWHARGWQGWDRLSGWCLVHTHSPGGSSSLSRGCSVVMSQCGSVVAN